MTAIHTLELRALRPVSLPMASAPDQKDKKRRLVRPALLVALGLSLLLHLAWSLWPADDIDTPEGTVLEATITEMPPPPVPSAQPAPPAPQKPTKRTRTIARKPTAPPAAIAAPDESAPVIDEGTPDVAKGDVPVGGGGCARYAGLHEVPWHLGSRTLVPRPIHNRSIHPRHPRSAPRSLCESVIPVLPGSSAFINLLNKRESG